MKSLRLRMTLFILSVGIGGAAIGAGLSFLYRIGILGAPTETTGIRFLDLLVILILVAMVVLLCILMSRVTANPIEAISKGMGEVAKGNFDVSVKIKRKTEEYAKLTANFNAMVAELKENEYLTKNFSANVSHEFKTPISIINGYAKLLSAPATDEETQKECVRYIITETERLTGMTENLLCISRIDSGKYKPAFSVFSLDEQIRRVVLQLEPRWHGKDILPEISLQSVNFYGCEELLTHAWYNLIDNAVKFSENSGRLTISLTQTASNVIFTVTDSGVGMPNETIDNAFNQFYRGGNAASESGSGLGLPLVRKITELHGGSVNLTSIINNGTTATVVLPKKSPCKTDAE